MPYKYFRQEERLNAPNYRADLESFIRFQYCREQTIYRTVGLIEPTEILKRVEKQNVFELTIGMEPSH